MRALKIAAWSGALVVGLSLTVLFLDVTSCGPVYELRPAKIVKVLPNPKWGFIGCDDMTVVRFEDGLTIQVGGNLGAPGDQISAHRQTGVATAFGIFGDNRFGSMKPTKGSRP